MQLDTDDLAAFLAGFIAAEGTFFRTGDRPSFRFAIGLGASDRSMCELAQVFFGRGRIYSSPRRRPQYDDEATLSIASLAAHLTGTVPFMDEHLPVSHKRRQYLAWRAQVLDYWEHEAKRVRPCTVNGCEAPRRARGLCRHHLYEQHGV